MSSLLQMKTSDVLRQLGRGDRRDDLPAEAEVAQILAAHPYVRAEVEDRLDAVEFEQRWKRVRGARDVPLEVKAEEVDPAFDDLLQRASPSFSADECKRMPSKAQQERFPLKRTRPRAKMRPERREDARRLARLTPRLLLR